MPQNKTLIMGPGGFPFGDYRRLGGLLLELLVVTVSIPDAAMGVAAVGRALDCCAYLTP